MTSKSSKIENMCYIAFTIIFVFAMFVITYINYSSHAFEFDELYTISFVSKHNSFTDMMRIFLTDEVTNPPLYDIFLFFWYRIVPKGVSWLLFPNYIFVVIAIFAIGCSVYVMTKRFRDVLFLAIIVLINPSSYQNMIYYLRSYSMAFMFSALFLWNYIKLRRNCSWKNIFKLTICSVCLTMTHYYGILFIAAFGIITLFYILKHKIKNISLIAYIMPCLITGSYLCVAFMHKTKDLTSFLGAKPSLKSLLYILEFAVTDKDSVYLMALILLLYFVLLFRKKKNLEKYEEGDNILFEAIWCICFVVSVAFIYAKINPTGSTYILKYFIVILPCIYYIFAYSLEYCISELVLSLNKRFSWNKDTLQIIFFALFLFMYSYLLVRWNIVGRLREKFEEIPKTKNMAEFIKEQDSVADDSVILIYQMEKSQWDVSKYPSAGLNEFYFDDSAAITDNISEAKEHKRVYLYYNLFAGKAFDGEKVNEQVNEDMAGFHIVKICGEDMGMIIYEKS